MPFNVSGEMSLRLSSGALRGVTSQIASGLKDIKAEVDIKISDSSRSGLAALNAQIGSLRSSLSSLSTDVRAAASSIDATGASLAQVKTGYSSVVGAIGQTSSALKQSAAASKEATGELERFGQQARLSGQRFGAFVISAGAMVTALNAFKSSVADAVSFERELIRLAQVSDSTVKQVAGIGKEVTRLSTTFGVSGQELLRAATVFKQAGLSINETKLALEGLAKASLAPDFSDIKSTAEGAVAIMSQFKVKANELEGALGSINAVAANFAVESKDIIEAVKKSGGAFQAAGGNLNEFIALFTSVRATTREGAEEIATGLRTIFSRIQRPQTIEHLRELGIELQHTKEEASRLGDLGLTNQFVGPLESIKRISEALSKIKGSDVRFAGVVEELGGYRQVSRVIPLIQEQAKVQQALNTATLGSISLTTSAERAQEALAVQVTKVKQEFFALGRNILESSGFRSLITGTLQLTSNLISVADALKPLIPLVTAFAAVKLGQNIGSFYSGFKTPITQKAEGGPVRSFHSGGRVPGNSNVDDTPAVLQNNEFVIKKRSAQSIGYAALDYANETGRLPGLAQGGSFKKRSAQAIGYGQLAAMERYADGGLTYKPDDHNRYEPGDRNRNIIRPTARQLRIAKQMKDQQLRDERIKNEVRLSAMTYAEYSDADIGNTAIAWRAAIDAEMARRQIQAFASGGRYSGYARYADGGQKKRKQQKPEFTFNVPTTSPITRPLDSIPEAELNLIRSLEEALGYAEPHEVSSTLAKLNALKAKHGLSLENNGISNDTHAAIKKLRFANGGLFNSAGHYAQGGKFEVLPPEKQARLEELIAQIQANPGASSFGESYAINQLKTAADHPTFSQIIGKTKRFLGAGVAGLAFEDADGDVIRIQPNNAEQAANKQSRKQGRGSFSSHLFSTDRPNVPGVLQPYDKISVGKKVGFTAEKLPLAQSAKDVSYKEIRELQNQLRGHGYENTDDHRGNLGIVGGKLVYVDPGGIRPLKKRVNDPFSGVPPEDETGSSVSAIFSEPDKRKTRRGYFDWNRLFGFGLKNQQLKTGLADLSQDDVSTGLEKKSFQPADFLKSLDRFKANKSEKPSTSEVADLNAMIKEFKDKNQLKAKKRAGFANGGNSAEEVNALVMPGEYIFNRQAASKIGLSNLEHMNRSGTLPKYHQGGLVRAYEDGSPGKVVQGTFANLKQNLSTEEYLSVILQVKEQYLAQVRALKIAKSTQEEQIIVQQKIVAAERQHLEYVVKRGALEGQSPKFLGTAGGRAPNVAPGALPPVPLYDRLDAIRNGRRTNAAQDILTNRSISGDKTDLSQVEVPQSLYSKAKPYLIPALAGGASIGADFLSSSAGTADQAVASGATTAFTNKKVGGAVLENALLGGSIGAGLGLGPLGIGIGVAAGGIRGFVTSIKQVNEEIREVKISNSITSLGDKLTELAAAVGGHAGDIAAAQTALESARTQITEKNIAAASGTFGGFDVKTFSELQKKELRSQLGSQLPSATNLLNKSIDDIAKKNPGADTNTLAEQFKKGNAGLNTELLNLIASVRGVPLGRVLEEYRRTIEEARNRVSGNKERDAAKKGEEQSIQAIGRLIGVVDTAVEAMRRLEGASKGLSDSFEGQISAIPTTSKQGLVGNFGITNKDLFKSGFDTIASTLGEPGKKLQDRAVAANSVELALASILPTILAGGNLQEDAIKDQVRGGLTSSLGGGDDVKRAINTVIGKLGEIKPEELLKKAEVDSTALVKELVAPLSGPLKEGAQRLQKGLEEGSNLLIDGLTKNAQRLLAIGEQWDRVAQLQLGVQRVEADLAAQAQGNRGGGRDLLTLGQLEEPFRARQERLAGPGAGAFDPRDIAGRLSRTRADIERQTQARDAALSSKGVGSPEFKNASEVLVKTQTEATKLAQALGHLSNVSERAAGVQEKLNALQEQRQSNVSGLRRFLGASSEEQLKQIGGARVLKGFGDIDPKNQAARIQFAQSLTPEDYTRALSHADQFSGSKLEGINGGPTGKAVGEALVLARAGRGLKDGLSPTANKEESALQGLLKNYSQEAKNAAAEYAKVQTSTQQQLLADLGTRLGVFVQELRVGLLEIKRTDVQNQLGTASTEQGRLVGLQKQRGLLNNFGVKDDTQLGLLREEKNRTLLREAFAKEKEGIDIAAAGENTARRIEDDSLFSNRLQTRSLRDLFIDEAPNQDPNKLLELYRANIQQHPKDGLGRITDEAVRKSFADSIRQDSQEKAFTLRDESQKKASELEKKTGVLFRPESLSPENEKPLNDILSSSTISFSALDASAKIAADQVKAFGDQLAATNAEIGKGRPTSGGFAETAASAISTASGTLDKAPAVKDFFQKFLGISGKASGGYISGEKGVDKIPAMLSHGEYVINAASTQANLPLLEHINRNKKKFAGGGIVSGTFDEPQAQIYEKKYIRKYGARAEDPRKFDNPGEYGLTGYAEGGPVDSGESFAEYQKRKQREAGIIQPKTDFQQYQAQAAAVDNKPTDFQTYQSQKAQVVADRKATLENRPTDLSGFSKVSIEDIFAPEKGVDIRKELRNQEADKIREDINGLNTNRLDAILQQSKEKAEAARRFVKDANVSGDVKDKASETVRDRLLNDAFVKGLVPQAKPVNLRDEYEDKNAKDFARIDAATRRKTAVALPSPALNPNFEQNYATRQAEEDRVRFENARPKLGGYQGTIGRYPNRLRSLFGLPFRPLRFAAGGIVPIRSRGYRPRLSESERIYQEQIRGIGRGEFVTQNPDEEINTAQKVTFRPEEAKYLAGVAGVNQYERPNQNVYRQALKNPGGASSQHLYQYQYGRDGTTLDFAQLNAVRNLQIQQRFARFGNDIGVRSFGLRGERNNLKTGLFYGSVQEERRRRVQQQTFAAGGIVGGSGFGDTVPALLEPGEGVLNRKAMAAFGTRNLNNINKYAQGGQVGSSGSSGGSVIDIAGSVASFVSATSGFENTTKLIAQTFTQFQSTSTALADAMKAFPHTLSIEGTQNLNIVLNGVEALARMQPEIKELVLETVQTEIKKLVRTKLADA